MGLKKNCIYIFPLSSTHLWLRCSNFFNTSKKNSFGCAANRKIEKKKPKTYQHPYVFTVHRLLFRRAQETQKPDNGACIIPAMYEIDYVILKLTMVRERSSITYKQAENKLRNYVMLATLNTIMLELATS
jgi:hypothetical protein